MAFVAPLCYSIKCRAYIRQSAGFKLSKIWRLVTLSASCVTTLHIKFTQLRACIDRVVYVLYTCILTARVRSHVLDGAQTDV